MSLQSPLRLEFLLPRFAKCDGHVFYTDTGSPGAEERNDRPVPLGGSVGHGKEPDFVRVSLPAQKVTRDQGGWLYHRCIMVHCEVFLHDTSDHQLRCRLSIHGG